MKFVNDGAKLRIVAETEQETAWIATLKESAKRVKPGSERFVVRAFNDWTRTGHSASASCRESMYRGCPTTIVWSESKRQPISSADQTTFITELNP